MTEEELREMLAEDADRDAFDPTDLQFMNEPTERAAA